MTSPARTLFTFAFLALVWCSVNAFPAMRYGALEKRLLNDTNPSGTSSKIRGVNLGGWFIVEQWMKPSLFQQAAQYAQPGRTAVDQYTFMTSINNNTIAKQLLTNHWSSWITEQDFQQIKQAGLNTVRIPVPHWAFNASTIEPYLPYAEVPYINQAVLWAQKYGLDVLLDLHTAPYSQNGADHSGRLGPIEFRNVSGAINAARVYSALTKLVQTYVNDPQYGGVVKAIELLNEPMCSVLGADYVTNVYSQAYSTVQSAVSANAITKPTIVMHDCWVSPLSQWQPVVAQGGPFANLPFILDTHRYHVFAPRANLTAAQHINLVHQDGQEIANATALLQRPIVTGEFSLGVSCTDCNYANNQQIAVANRQFFETQTTAYEQGAGWIFWNWKSENNVPWSYISAVQAGWIPLDPTEKTYAI